MNSMGMSGYPCMQQHKFPLATLFANPTGYNVDPKQALHTASRNTVVGYWRLQSVSESHTHNQSCEDLQHQQSKTKLNVQ